MNLIILTEKDKKEKDLFSVNDNRFDHITKILKSEINDVIQVGFINGGIGEGIVTEINKDNVIIKLKDLKNHNKIETIIDIICALPRPQTLKKVLATCATMGVNHLYLIRSEKVEKSYFHSPLLEESNYTKFLIEGLSQGKRTKLPTVSIHNKFKKFFEEEFSSNDSTCIFAHPDVNKFLSTEIINSEKKIIIAIGPEGGWNNFEVNFMSEKGFKKFMLSKNILRVENAVTASLAQVELLLNKN